MSKIKQYSKIFREKPLNREIKMSSNQIETLRVLCYEGESCWIAQLLEYDIVAQSKTQDDLQEAIEHAILSHIVVSLENKQVPFENINPAPKKYWDMYKKSHTSSESDFKSSLLNCFEEHKQNLDISSPAIQNLQNTQLERRVAVA